MGHEQGRLRGVEGRHERVAAEDAGQSVNGAHGVLAGGGEVASNSTESLRAGTVKLTDLVSNQRLGHSLSC